MIKIFFRGDDIFFFNFQKLNFEKKNLLSFHWGFSFRFNLVSFSCCLWWWWCYSCYSSRRWRLWLWWLVNWNALGRPSGAPLDVMREAIPEASKRFYRQFLDKIFLSRIFKHQMLANENAWNWYDFVGICKKLDLEFCYL